MELCGGDCGGERFGSVLQLLRRRLDECETAIAAADTWMSNWLRAADIAAAPRRICGGDCGGGRVELCGGACVEERYGCVLRVFQRLLVECAAAIAAEDDWLCTLTAAIAAAEDLK